MDNQDLYKLFANQKIINVEIEKEMKKSFMDYAMSVIVARALPDVRDGLKPVHRRILYTMYEDNLTPDRPFLKSATTVGDVLGRYHPHGDAAVYDAMVRMAQSFSLRYPLVLGQGNFGNIDGDGAAAYRYTEAKMAKITMEMLRDIDKETVEFIPNYDERHSEPSVLPSRFPNLLVNGSTGIAVGMATSIPPHNLGEIIDGVIFLLENNDANIEQILNFIKGPDFPTGGLIMGKSAIRQAYYTGRGKVTVRAKVEIEEYKENRNRIVITEIPYMVNKSKLIQDIAEHVNNKKIEGIHDLRDESDRNGMSIIIELKKDANPQIILNQLYSYTQLQDTFSVILLALVDNQPKVLNIKQMLEEYIKFQKEIVIRKTQYDLKKAKERAHILEGLLKALDHIDEVIHIIRSSQNVTEAKEKLIEIFDFSEIQAQRIVDMRLGQLTGLERNRLLDEFSTIMLQIKEFEAILASDEKIMAIIKKDLLDIKEQFNDERRTQLMAIDNDIDIEDLIEEKTCVYTFTNYGYIKRIPVETYKVQKRGGKGITAMTTRDEDFANELFIGSSHNIILFFTSSGRVYRIKGYEIPETSRQSKGMNVVNLLELSQNEKITAMIPIKNIEEGYYLNMVTNKGISKRTRLIDYKNLRKAGLNAIDLDEDDSLISVKLTDGNCTMLVASHKGMVIQYDENDVRVLGRNARGVRVIRLTDDDHVVGMVTMIDGKTLLTVTENGYGKRTENAEYKTQKRGGKGIKGHKITEKTGLIAGIKAVDEGEDLIVISSDGIIIRIKISDIPNYGRTSSGVRIMRFNGDAKVVNIATLNSEDDEEIPTVAVTVDEEDALEAENNETDDINEGSDETNEIENDEKE
ncbi:MAG: gyrA [Clostridia bacterium]|nr:gyrA [Clostridia bacterium]